MDKLKMQSVDIVNQNLEKIAALFPNCITEYEGRKAIDFELLKQELNYALVEGNKERYRLEWPGKREALVTANIPIGKTLRPILKDSVDFNTTKNIYIEGDNLETLKLLQESYLNKIKMIYIDPPYNTGKDFIYSDNFYKNKSEEMLDSGQIDEYNQKLFSNPETAGRYHSDWLNMQYSRIKLSKNLLSNDGVIFISIDDNEQANLRKICDEIFGEQNFVANLVWLNKEGGGSSDSLHFKIKHEYILCYAKNKPLLKIAGIAVTDEERYTLSDQHEKERGKYQLIKLDSASLGYIVSLDYPIEAIDGSQIYPNKDDKKISRWRWGKDKLKWGFDNDFVVIKKDRLDNWAVYTKQYLNCDSDGNLVPRTNRPFAVIEKYSSTTSSNELEELFNAKKIFSFSKPYELIKYLISLVSLNSDDFIMDFYSGSATTAQATMQLNAEDLGSRSFILVQLPETTDEKSEAYKAGYKNICEIGKERIRRVANKIKGDTNADIDYGFRVYRLDESNMKDVYYRPQDYDQSNIDMFADNVKPDRTADDLLTQIMLDWGLPLHLKIELLEIAGKQVYKVDDDSLYACFDKDLDEAFAKEIAKSKPLRVVFRDSGFKNNSAKTNVKQLLKQLSPETEMKVI